MNCDEYLDALLTLPMLEEPHVSRDGRWVAWTWYRAGPAADVYAAPTDGTAPPLRLTDTQENTLLVSWTPDSRSLLVSQDRAGDERAQLFRVDLNRPGVMQPLTEPSPHFFLRGGQLHPNGRWLIYAANWDQAAAREIEPTWLYRHDLLTGERLPLARPERGCHYLPILNEQGTHILYQRNDRHPAGRQIWLVDVEGREDRELYSAGPQAKAWASWLPDGRRVLLLAEAGTHLRVGVLELASGALHWLIDDPQRNVEAAYVPHGSSQAVVLDSRQARTHASLLDLASGEEASLPILPHTMVPLAPVGSGEWVGQIYSSRQPADLVRCSLAEPQPTIWPSLTRIWERTRLSAGILTPAEDLRWRSVDGLEVQGWLYRASGEARGTIVHVHGGPTWHLQDEVLASVQFLARQGFHVLLPNYRGSTGFGLAYREAIKADGWGGLEQEDIRAGIEVLRAAGLARPGRVGITGTSYGGYSSWHAITHWPPETVAAAAPICGMTDLVVDWQNTRPDLKCLSEEMLGGSPAEAPARYRERSPLHFVPNIRGRLLIVQGMQDPNVSPENVRVVREALDRSGVPYELLTFDDEGHGIAKPANQKVLYQRLADFFGQAFGAQ